MKSFVLALALCIASNHAAAARHARKDGMVRRSHATPPQRGSCEAASQTKGSKGDLRTPLSGSPPDLFDRFTILEHPA